MRRTLWAQRSHDAAGTFTSNTGPSIPAMPLVRAPVVRALESYRDSAAPAAFLDAGTQESSRIHSHLPEARKAGLALLGHRGYTRISTRLAMLSHLSIPGAVTRDHRSHSGSYCVCGTCNFAHPGARRLTLESHPATKRGGRKLNRQSRVLPCVFTGSVVSDTPQRLWPGAQWTVAVQGTKGQHLVYSIEAQTAPRRKARRADEATAIAISPRPPKGPGALASFRVSR